MFDFKRENCQEWTTVKFTIYPHMNKTILLGLALAASVSSASAYHADKYDGQFGMSLEGAYGIATKDAMPNVAGGNLSIFNYIETGSIVHQISLNGGNKSGGSGLADEAGRRFKPANRNIVQRLSAPDGGSRSPDTQASDFDSRRTDRRS